MNPGFQSFSAPQSRLSRSSAGLLMAVAMLGASVCAQRDLYRYSVVRMGVTAGSLLPMGWFNNRDEVLLRDPPPCSGTCRYYIWSPANGVQMLPTTCPNDPSRRPMYQFLNNRGQLVASGCVEGPNQVPKPYLFDINTQALTPVVGGPACANGASLWGLNDAGQFVAAQCGWYLGSTTASYQALNLGSLGSMQVSTPIFLGPTGTALWTSWDGTTTKVALVSVGAPPRTLLPQATRVQGAGFIGTGELSVLYWTAAGANYNGIVDGQGNVRVQFGPRHYITGGYDSVSATEQAVLRGGLNASSTTNHLWLYQDGALTNLERLMPDAACWLNSVQAINDSGTIFGDCTMAGVRELILLKPGTQPSLALHVEPGARSYTGTPADPRYHIPFQTPSITLHLSGGQSSQPVGIFVTDSNGNPFVPALGIGMANADGSYSLQVTIPRGLRGDVPLKAYGYHPRHGILDSLSLVLAFP